MERKQSPLKKLFAIRGMGQVVTVTVGLVILCIVFGILNPMFFSGKNVGNLLRQIAPILMIGIGQSYVLITGNIDLSIGSVVGMSCMISATLMTKGVNPWAAVVITFVCCIAVGVLNGQLVANCNTDSIGEGAQGFRDFFYYGKLAGVYNTIWIAIVLWLVFNFVLSKTRTGRHIYAVGSNIEAARLSGVNVITSTTKAYVVSSICACVVGLVTCATSGMGTMDAGNMYEMYAVAASVIGGVSTLGGQGILLGTVIGASIWGVLQNGLQFAGAPVAIRNIVIGIIVVVSVLLDVVVRSGRKPRRKKEPAAAKAA